MGISTKVFIIEWPKKRYLLSAYPTGTAVTTISNNAINEVRKLRLRQSSTCGDVRILKNFSNPTPQCKR